MKPCDCKDRNDTKKLNESGISFNDKSIIVLPNIVELTIGSATIKIPMNTFKAFAEWYLKNQDE